MAPLFSYQPFKALMTLFLLCAAPPCLLFWTIYYTPKALRPNHEWSLGTCIGNAGLRWWYKYATAIRLGPWLIQGPKDSKSIIEVTPRDVSLYRGVLDHPRIKPVPKSAIWLPRPYDSAKDTGKPVVLHFQGGAFVTYGDAAQLGVAPAKAYEKAFGALTFYAQYRQARDDSSRFPAAVQDVVTFYSYLLSMGVRAKDVFVAGDSSGGNLVVAFLRYLEEHEGVLPRPGGALLWSPWVNLNADFPAVCNTSAAATDFLPSGLLEWGAKAYGPLPPDVSEDVQAYVSPMGHPFATKTPVWVNAGSAEIFHNDISEFAKEMEGVAGNRVRYFDSPNMPHDILVGVNVMPVGKEVEEALQDAVNLFEKGLKGGT
ncbi:MAG: hypothetical protein M1820_008520 [Bogoriella megaspora]|nr:MAG: hypothetical protein M1820_008520 [Bogoriella megaspora]